MKGACVTRIKISEENNMKGACVKLVRNDCRKFLSFSFNVATERQIDGCVYMSWCEVSYGRVYISPARWTCCIRQDAVGALTFLMKNIRSFSSKDIISGWILREIYLDL